MSPSHGKLNASPVPSDIESDSTEDLSDEAVLQRHLTFPTTVVLLVGVDGDSVPVVRRQWLLLERYSYFDAARRFNTNKRQKTEASSTYIDKIQCPPLNSKQIALFLMLLDGMYLFDWSHRNRDDLAAIWEFCDMIGQKLWYRNMFDPSKNLVSTWESFRAPPSLHLHARKGNHTTEDFVKHIYNSWLMLGNRDLYQFSVSYKFFNRTTVDGMNHTFATTSTRMDFVRKLLLEGIFVFDNANLNPVTKQPCFSLCDNKSVGQSSLYQVFVSNPPTTDILQFLYNYNYWIERPAYPKRGVTTTAVRSDGTIVQHQLRFELIVCVKTHAFDYLIVKWKRRNGSWCQYRSLSTFGDMQVLWIQTFDVHELVSLVDDFPPETVVYRDLPDTFGDKNTILKIEKPDGFTLDKFMRALDHVEVYNFQWCPENACIYLYEDYGLISPAIELMTDIPDETMLDKMPASRQFQIDCVPNQHY